MDLRSYTFVARLCTWVWIYLVGATSGPAVEFAITETNTIKLVEFPASDFKMGCPNKPPAPWQAIHFDYCRPEHEVKLSAFAISKYPVTESQYCQFLNEAGFHASYTQDDRIFKYLRRKPVFSSKRANDDYPISGVTPTGAEAYCQWLSIQTKRKCRLPTEAEWEFVARGKQNRTYPWGETQHSAHLEYKPVGAHPHLATPDGVHDMNGPVYQWCLDAYDPKFYFKSPLINPVCTNGTARILRGGPMFRSYKEKYWMAPTWKRFKTTESDIMAGFRIVIEDAEAKTNSFDVQNPVRR